jgi:hypothetical protein
MTDAMSSSYNSALLWVERSGIRFLGSICFFNSLTLSISTLL